MTQNYCLKMRSREEKVQALLEENRIDLRELDRGKIDLRAEHRRINRNLYKQKEEADLQQRVLMAKEAELTRRCQREQEEKLAQDLACKKNEEVKEIKLRQHLRENNVELRELEAQLKLAYARKCLVAQCAERRAAEMEEKMRDKFFNQKMQEHLEYEQKVAEEKELQEGQKKLELRKDLQDQLIAKEKIRQREYHEFLEEKRLIDEITARILEEDARMMREECQKRKKTKEELEEFMKIQEEYKQKRKKDLEEEDKRLLGYMEQKAKEEEEHRRNQMEKLWRQEQTAFVLGTRVYEQELQKMEYAELLDDLHVMRAQSISEGSRLAELEARVRRRFQLRQDSIEQARLRYERLKREADMDRMWTQQMLAKFAEDDRIHQLTLQKQWEKQLEHRRSVQQMLEQRRAERAAEMTRLLKEQEQDECEEEQRRKIVEEERLRMLREHAVNVLGYLPRGVLREDDLPHLGSDVVDKLKELQVSPKLTD